MSRSRERPEEVDPPHEDADARAGAEGDELGSPAKRAVAEMFARQLDERPGPGEGSGHTENGNSDDGGAGNRGARNLRLATAIATGIASRIAAESKVSTYFDQVEADDKAGNTMPEAVTQLVQNEPVVVTMRCKDDGEKASTAKFKVAKRNSRQTADDRLRTTRKNCTSIMMSMILAALMAGDFYGDAPTFSRVQLCHG